MTRYTRHCEADDIDWAILQGSLDFFANGIAAAYDLADSRFPISKGDAHPKVR
jgi:5-methylthioadenosine/S-adenosylhomocysteine deaminase